MAHLLNEIVKSICIIVTVEHKQINVVKIHLLHISIRDRQQVRHGCELELDTKGIPMMQGKIMANAPHEPQPNFPSIPR